MGTTYSTGELAKGANVSIRTVQYYDKEGILQASGRTEGGRRMYSEEDLLRLRTIGLYRVLGLSLEEIRKLMPANDGNGQGPLQELLRRQLGRLEEEQEDIRIKRERIEAILQAHEESGRIEVDTLEELEALIKRKERHRRTDRMTLLFLGGFLLFAAGVFPMAVSYGGSLPYLLLAVGIGMVVGLAYYHSAVNAYRCPACGCKFEIGFRRDLFSLNGGKKGKRLSCPHCGRKGWFQETHPD
ncbi:MerR family transcriptional regulator [Gorillibacterium sp. CAU 1737]|uniref:MerR family transcriptional regulator n=1 Tax=Gorillibacterium sp. CAU 1737 TaxID=3140362 RepID=UPI00325FFE37